MIDLERLEDAAKAADQSGIHFEFAASVRPAEILALIAEVRALRETIKLQASAARAGMDAAKSSASILYQEAVKARAESSPDVLASERAMNAVLTEENERLHAFHDFFRDRCEGLFAQFGMPAVDAYNDAARGAK